ncbi:HNH endonuclease signature motif containing protein, partial [Nocardia sp. SYP-A9097]|uniref:HNH endonuclease signature motif containing protein n=1 Tax=Nocardia sp. SYP-A9097 TaxID=2663237 RepID=UPI001E5997FC
RADGMRSIKGELTPEFSALLDPVLAKFARPGMCNPEDAESPTTANTPVDSDVLRAAASRDARSAAQRIHDAILALLKPGVTPDGLGTHQGLPVATILTMTIDQVEDAAGVATLATGGTVPLKTALRLAERSRPYLAVFDHAGMVLHLGQGKRLASPAQRLASIASIRGCSRPGCDAPASLSAVHHVTEWSKDGPTDLSNETLACDHCHALVHDGPGGWQTIVLGQGSAYPGRTGWIAPTAYRPHADRAGQPPPPSRGIARANHRAYHRA